MPLPSVGQVNGVAKLQTCRVFSNIDHPTTMDHQSENKKSKEVPSGFPYPNHISLPTHLVQTSCCIEIIYFILFFMQFYYVIFMLEYITKFCVIFMPDICDKLYYKIKHKNNPKLEHNLEKSPQDMTKGKIKCLIDT